jgi:hypothetical protein
VKLVALNVIDSKPWTIQRVSPAEHDQHIRIVIKLTKMGFHPRERQLNLLLSYESLLWAGAEKINSQALLTAIINDDA